MNRQKSVPPAARLVPGPRQPLIGRRAVTCGAMLILGSSFLPSTVLAAQAAVRVDEAGEGLSTGVIEVRATPAEVRAALLDFAHWPRLFVDVKGSKIQSRAENHAIIEVECRSLGRRGHKLRVWTTLPDRTPFELVNGRGVKLLGEFSFQPLGDGITRVRGTLRTKATGVVGLIVREKSLRNERRSKLSHYLADLQARFPR